VSGLGVEKFADKSLLFSLTETYARGKDLPASLVSDGTINITELIVALYFERKPVAVIEEPERSRDRFTKGSQVDSGLGALLATDAPCGLVAGQWRGVEVR